MAAVLVQVCVDHRLNHELLRIQVRQRLQRLGLSADRIYILNEVGGNLGSNFVNTVDLLVKRGERVVSCAVLHHDDCLAAKQGVRETLETTAQKMALVLVEQKIRCPVLTGVVLLENNLLLWSDDRHPQYTPFSFGMY